MHLCIMSTVPHDIITLGPQEGTHTVKVNMWKYCGPTSVIKAAVTAVVFSEISESICKTKGG